MLNLLFNWCLNCKFKSNNKSKVCQIWPNYHRLLFFSSFWNMTVCHKHLFPKSVELLWEETWKNIFKVNKNTQRGSVIYFYGMLLILTFHFAMFTVTVLREYMWYIVNFIWKHHRSEVLLLTFLLLEIFEMCCDGVVVSVRCCFGTKSRRCPDVNKTYKIFNFCIKICSVFIPKIKILQQAPISVRFQIGKISNDILDTDLYRWCIYICI